MGEREKKRGIYRKRVIGKATIRKEREASFLCRAVRMQTTIYSAMVMVFIQLLFPRPWR